MNVKRIIEKNIVSSKKYGWTPEWFGHDDFDEELIKLIIEFQHEFSLGQDGIVGPVTYRRLETELLVEQDFKPAKRNKRKGEKGIIYNGNKYPIKWEKIILWDERGGLPAKKGTYYDWSKKPARQPVQFVNHWDATLSSEACARIIGKRGLSMHFLIDNDGTIYQMLDIQHPAWQAGSKFWNTNGIGVEISNAYYTKYQNWYVKNGFGERPVVESEVHGVKLGKHLDFYPVQLEALALFKKKNKDYGDSFADYGTIGVIVRMMDKINRLVSLEKNGIIMVNDEQIRDTLIDLHNYAAMGVMLLDNDNKD